MYKVVILKFNCEKLLPISVFVDVFFTAFFKEIFLRLLCCLFFVFVSLLFLNALQNDNNSNTVYVLAYKYVLHPSHSSF